MKWKKKVVSIYCVVTPELFEVEKNQNFDTASKSSGVTTQYILTTFIFHFNHVHSRSNTQSMNDVMIDWHKNLIKIWMSISTFKLNYNFDNWSKNRTQHSLLHILDKVTTYLDRYLQTDSVKKIKLWFWKNLINLPSNK